MTPAFDAYIFDLDGTLIDTLPDLVNVTNAALAAEGYSPRTREEILSYVGNGPKALIAQALSVGTPASADAPSSGGVCAPAPEPAVDGTPDPASAAEFEEAVNRVFARWQAIHQESGISLSQPYPHVAAVLASLKAQGCKLAVLSNKFDEGVRQVMNVRLPGLFDLAYGERPDIPRKPDPTGLLRVASELGVPPNRCAYVGDSPSDVLAARNAGVYAIGVTWGYRSLEDFAADAQPDRWIRDPRELLQ